MRIHKSWWVGLLLGVWAINGVAAVAYADLGTFQTTAGSASMTTTASSITGTNGGLMVLMSFYNYNSGTAGGQHSETLVTGTWSGTFTKQAECFRDTVTSNQYAESVQIWTAPISGSPSGTIIYSTTDIPGTSIDGWFGFKLLNVTGQNTSPIGLTASPSPQVSAPTYNTDLGSVPASTSLVVGVVHDDNDTGPLVTQPSGWTELDEQAPSWGAISEWALKNGSSVQSPQWSGFTNSASTRVCGAALEILVAGGGASSKLPLIIPQFTKLVPANDDHYLLTANGAR